MATRECHFPSDAFISSLPAANHWRTLPPILPVEPRLIRKRRPTFASAIIVLSFTQISRAGFWCAKEKVTARSSGIALFLLIVAVVATGGQIVNVEATVTYSVSFVQEGALGLRVFGPTVRIPLGFPGYCTFAAPQIFARKPAFTKRVEALLKLSISTPMRGNLARLASRLQSRRRKWDQRRDKRYASFDETGSPITLAGAGSTSSRKCASYTGATIAHVPVISTPPATAKINSCSASQNNSYRSALAGSILNARRTARTGPSIRFSYQA